MIANMLSTEDNPYNPFDNFDEWYQFDTSNSYHSCAYVDRIAITSNELSEEDEAEAIEQAIDEIIKFNVTGNYIKVSKEFIDSDVA
jgi:hypothetical protein